MASYEHAYALGRVRGEVGGLGRLQPLTVDELIYAASMVVLDSARYNTPTLRWRDDPSAWGIAANVAHCLGHDLMGAAVATGHVGTHVS